MRVSVVQMNPGADKADNIAQAAPPDRRARSPRTGPTSSACRRCGTCLGGDRATRIANAETLPPHGSNEPGGPAYEFLRDTARAAQGARAWRLDHRAGAGEAVQHHRRVQPGRHRDSRATARSTCSTSSRPTAPAIAKATPTAPATRSSPTRPTACTVGCAICYDVRFPDLFLELRRAGRRADLPALGLHRCRPARTIGRR